MPALATSDDEDLEALFDQVSAERERVLVARGRDDDPSGPGAIAASSAESAAQPIFARVGQLTRALHDSLRELGYDRKIDAAANALPDARDRLDYIAKLSGDSAEKVLASVEAGQGALRSLDARAHPLQSGWEQAFAGALTVDAFKALAGQTRSFFAALPADTTQVRSTLHDIMMAQDFHDLTGQVIARVAGIAHTLEKDLLAALIEASPGSERPVEGFLSGPAVPGRNPADAALGQAQADQLLESLGF